MDVWDQEDDVVEPLNGHRSSTGQAAQAVVDTAGITVPATAPAVPPPADLRTFPTLESWVNDWFTVVFARYPGAGRRWCPLWWQHPEAVHRLKDLYWAWEVLRLKDDLGMSVWLEQMDRQRDRLMADDGPFMNCSEDSHQLPPRLPVVPAPQGYWDGTND